MPMPQRTNPHPCVYEKHELVSGVISDNEKKKQNVKMKIEGGARGSLGTAVHSYMTNENTGTWSREEDLVGGDSRRQERDNRRECDHHA